MTELETVTELGHLVFHECAFSLYHSAALKLRKINFAIDHLLYQLVETAILKSFCRQEISDTQIR